MSTRMYDNDIVTKGNLAIEQTTAAYAGKLYDSYWDENINERFVSVWLNAICKAILVKCSEGENRLLVSDVKNSDLQLTNFKVSDNYYSSKHEQIKKVRVEMTIDKLENLGYEVHKRNGSILIVWQDHCTNTNEYTK